MNPISGQLRMMAESLERRAHDQELLAGDLRQQARQLRILAADRPGAVPPERPVSITRDVIQAVCIALSVSFGEIGSDVRTPEIVEARHIAMFAAWHSAKASTREIGTLLNRESKSVAWALQQVRNRSATNKSFSQKLSRALEAVATEAAA